MQVTYEAYGAGGTGFVMECLTDNLNRSASEVRAAVQKAGGKMADPGSVLFNFTRQGQVFVSPEAKEDQVQCFLLLYQLRWSPRIVLISNCPCSEVSLQSECSEFFPTALSLR